MRRWDETAPHKSRIEIIPMIDVMMFLLVFFVLISINVIPALGVKTTLPQSAQAQDMKAVKNVVVTLGKNGELQVDGRVVSVEEVPGAVKALERPGTKTNVVINADEGVIWQRVLDVMDELKGGGFEALNFASKKR
jgi:biopolymer transport protein ExbD